MLLSLNLADLKQYLQKPLKPLNVCSGAERKVCMNKSTECAADNLPTTNTALSSPEGTTLGILQWQVFTGNEWEFHLYSHQYGQAILYSPRRLSIWSPTVSRCALTTCSLAERQLPSHASLVTGTTGSPSQSSGSIPHKLAENKEKWPVFCPPEGARHDYSTAVSIETGKWILKETQLSSKTVAKS